MKKKLLTNVKNLCLVVAGTAVLSFAVAVFILPFDLVVGGVSGIAILLNALMPFLSADFFITAVTWAIFLLGLICLGKHFAWKTLVSTAVYPVGVMLCSRLVDPSVLGGMFCLSAYENLPLALLLSAVFGGALIGAGCALTFLGGGSSGGVDVLAFLVCKLFKKLRPSGVIFTIDALIIGAGLFLFRDLLLCLLGITAAFVGAVAVDKLFLGESQAFLAQIVSQKYETINREIGRGLERTTSIMEIEGGYSGEKKKMLFVSFSANQYRKLIDIVNQADPAAFVTVHRAHQINGEGWTR